MKVFVYCIAVLFLYQNAALSMEEGKWYSYVFWNLAKRGDISSLNVFFDQGICGGSNEFYEDQDHCEISGRGQRKRVCVTRGSLCSMIAALARADQDALESNTDEAHTKSRHYADVYRLLTIRYAKDKEDSSVL